SGGVLELGLAEGGLRAALRQDRHAGADRVEATGVQSRDEGAELHGDTLDLIDAELPEDLAMHGHGRAGELTVLLEAVGGFAGEADRDGAGFLEPREQVAVP